jgi:hypothetical protein
MRAVDVGGAPLAQLLERVISLARAARNAKATLALTVVTLIEATRVELRGSARLCPNSASLECGDGGLVRRRG